MDTDMHQLLMAVHWLAEQGGRIQLMRAGLACTQQQEGAPGESLGQGCWSASMPHLERHFHLMQSRVLSSL